MKKRRLTFFCVTVLAALSIMNVSCVGNKARSDIIWQDIDTQRNDTYHEKIMVGDKLELAFFKAYPKDLKSYFIDIEDLISIEADGHSELDQKRRVQPDGIISLNLIGTYHAKGKTVPQIEEEIKKLYQKIFPGIEFSVSVPETQKKIDSFISIFQNSPGGNTKEYIVMKNGTLELPFIESIIVAGKTPYELRKEIKDTYDNIFHGYIDVTVNIKTKAVSYFYVMGEVNLPGVKVLNGVLNPLNAIATAGGLTDEGLPEEILLLRFNRDNTYRYLKINLDKAMEDPQYIANKVKIEPNDYIFVSKSSIAKIDLFVDQYIRKVLPVNVSTGIVLDSRSF